ncbi:MAG: winged helix-turn-helix transcriptional regulator [Phenylobacterium sp.]
MRSKSFAGMACSVAGALEQIGDRWAFLILRDLSFAPARFDDLRETTGMPNTTLSDRLRRLEASGLLEKRPYQEHPPRAQYALTAKGRDLLIVLVALAEWGDRWDASGFGAPPILRVDRETGRPVRLALVDAETGEIVPTTRMAALPGPAADEPTRRRLTPAPAGDA